ncbi:MAG: M23 family metallopeptidase [Desulfobacteraceae bacterium]|nr:M23 family metallopeptidase [Desulfobacteraceae bacterium]
MDDKLHVVITSVYGRTHTFSLSRRRLKSMAVLILAGVLVFGAAGFAGFGFSAQNLALQARAALLQNRLQSSLTRAHEYEARIAQQEKEKKELVQHALAELNQRSRAIESILSTVGVKINIEESDRNAGGPFTSTDDSSYEDLTLKVDQYLEAIQFIPLGAPLPGTITSKFGWRSDPINQRTAFHQGLDIRNSLGTKVMATADGVVAEKGYTSGFGNYIVLDHGNHFRTRFFHLEKSMVEQGQRVTRGQLIGYLGNTGRSTGPHLHYEIKYRGKSVDPLKFMRIARYVSLDKAE